MKTCEHCKIQVGNQAKACPLCQSPLKGQDHELYWPHPKSIKAKSILSRIFLFLLFIGNLVCYSIDFIFGIHTRLHWSLPVIFCSICMLVLFAYFSTHRQNISRIIFQGMVLISVILILTGWYCGFRFAIISYVMPILCCVALVLNFIFCLIDRGYAENALVYMLLNILVGVIPYIFISHARGRAPMPWIISLLLSIITFAGLLIFKGSTVVNEIQKRLHI